jgi:hypothetical protein
MPEGDLLDNFNVTLHGSYSPYRETLPPPVWHTVAFCLFYFVTHLFLAHWDQILPICVIKCLYQRD